MSRIIYKPNNNNIKCDNSPGQNKHIHHTSMLTGADCRGCRYSGWWSKWLVCAVNILSIRIGSCFAWRIGSKRVDENTNAPVGELQLSLLSQDSEVWLRISCVIDPKEKYLIGEGNENMVERGRALLKSRKSKVYNYPCAV